MGVISTIGTLLLTGTLVVSGFHSQQLDYANALVDEFDCYREESMEIASWANRGVFDCSWDPGNVRFKDGQMQLWLTVASEKYQKKYPYKYSGAEYRSRAFYGYGLYSVSMKPARNDGVCSSFFLHTGQEDGNPREAIDIEFPGKDTTKVQFNYSENDNMHHEYIYDLGFDASEAFHEYAFLWTEDFIKWFVDGKEAYKVTATANKLPTIPCKIMMNFSNLIDSPNMNSWVGKYDGSVDIYTAYKYMEYIPLTELTDQEKPIYPVTEVDFTEGWTCKDGSSEITKKSNGIRITHIQNPETHEDYVSNNLTNVISNPKTILMKLEHQSGYLFSLTPVLLNKDQIVAILDNQTIVSQKGQHTLNFQIPTDIGQVDEIRLMINSQAQYIDVSRNSYTRILIEEATIKNE